MAIYYCLPTAAALTKLAAAQVAQTTVDLAEFAVGDGGGAYYEPTDAATALVNETWRAAIESVKVSPNNSHQIVISALIPASSGGFDIREAAVFDADGDLFAVGKYPLTSKPAPGSGSEKDIYVRMILELTGAAEVTQTIDPSVITLTQAHLDQRDWKNSVRAATVSANVTLAGGAPASLDGVSLAVNDRVLVKNQSAAAENGVYTVQALGTGSDGTWIRASDADSDLDVTANLAVSVEEGTANAASLWMLSTDAPILLDTTPLVFDCLHGPGDKVDGHANLTAPHSATSAATADRLMIRDGSGRVKAVAPLDADDVALKGTVDAHGALQASTSGSGHVALATPLEAQGLSDGAKALTAAALASVLGEGGAAANDFVKIPFKDDGTGELKHLIVQWGKLDGFLGSSTEDVITTLPMAFPTAGLGLAIQTSYTPGTGQVTYNSGWFISNSQFACRSSQSAQGTQFIAVGI